MMINTWAEDIEEMHEKFDFHEKVSKLSKEDLITLLKFRFDFLKEEYTEGAAAIENGDAEEVVDSLIDLIVVAIGTLDLFDIDKNKAWDAVHVANMAKKAGIKKERPNPLGLPDLFKPEGWTAPSHEGNHGKIKDMF